MKNINELIKSYRQRSGLTTTELANAIGVSPASISHIETGRRNPSDKVLEKIIEVLNIPEEESNKLIGKKKVLVGAEIVFSSKYTNVKISIGTEINDEYEDIDQKAKKQHYSFESPVIIETIKDFFAQNKNEIFKQIQSNLKKKAEKLAETTFDTNE